MAETDTISSPPPSRHWLTRMTARSPHESHRAATPLELFFDLVFVVAIAQAANGLHHASGRGTSRSRVLIGYLMVFFAIWWAWMAFTWFASAYDCDDVPYRLLVFVQIAGALLHGGGHHGDVRNADAEHCDGRRLRRHAARAGRAVAACGRRPILGVERRHGDTRSASSSCRPRGSGCSSCRSTGCCRDSCCLAALDVSRADVGRASVPTTWHPHHITERYGSADADRAGGVDPGCEHDDPVRACGRRGRCPICSPLIVGGLLIVYSMWWVYFDRPVHDLLTSVRKAFIWGYGHYFVFASAAAVGAGLAVAVDAATHHAKIGPVGAGVAVAVPVATYLVCLWVLHNRPEYRPTRFVRSDSSRAHSADAVHGARGAADRSDSGDARRIEAGRASK